MLQIIQPSIELVSFRLVDTRRTQLTDIDDCETKPPKPVILTGTITLLLNRSNTKTNKYFTSRVITLHQISHRSLSLSYIESNGVCESPFEWRRLTPSFMAVELLRSIVNRTWPAPLGFRPIIPA